MLKGFLSIALSCLFSLSYAQINLLGYPQKDVFQILKTETKLKNIENGYLIGNQPITVGFSENGDRVLYEFNDSLICNSYTFRIYKYDLSFYLDYLKKNYSLVSETSISWDFLQTCPKRIKWMIISDSHHKPETWLLSGEYTSDPNTVSDTPPNLMPRPTSKIVRR